MSDSEFDELIETGCGCFMGVLGIVIFLMVIVIGTALLARLWVWVFRGVS